MLVVHRKVGERLVLGGGIEITVVAATRGGVRLAVQAPKDVWIARGEVHDAAARANAAAVAGLEAASDLMESIRIGGADEPEEPK
jgi:carbon storage regulator